jgi:DNA-binding PadR family transcriptional regulator
MDLDQCVCSGKTLDRFLRPTILGLLARERTHGYDLVQQLQKLKMFSDIPPDTSGVYKVLKSMEEEGLVSSSWELGDVGPAKRSYAPTKNGMACLQRWMETLTHYRSQINGLLNILDLKKRLPEGGRAKNCCSRKKRAS